MTSMTAVWLLPVVPAIVAANSAGLLAQHLDVRHGGSLVFLGECTSSYMCARWQQQHCLCVQQVLRL